MDLSFLKKRLYLGVENIKDTKEIKIMKKITGMLLGLVLIVAMATGCAKQNSTEKTSETETALPEKVRIGTQEMPNDEGIAKAQNYFEEELNVPVEVIQFDSGRDVNAALLSNSIDFGLVGSCPATLVIANGAGVELIWIHDVLGSVESLAVRSDAGISTVEDLKGKTIATPFASTAHFSLLKLFEVAGIGQDEVEVLDMQPAEIYAAWENKDIDGAYIWEPTLSQLTDVSILKTSADLADEGYMTSNVELVTTEFSEKYPELVVGYIKALEKAVTLYKEDSEAAVDVIAKKLNIEPESAKFQMSGSIWLACEEQIGAEFLGTSSEKGDLVNNLYETAKFLKDQGSMSELPDKAIFEQAVNPSYIEQAME